MKGREKRTRRGREEKEKKLFLKKKEWLINIK